MKKYSRYLTTGAVVLIAVAVVLFKYWAYLTNPWTRNGQVQADVIQIATRVSGPIVKLPIHVSYLLYLGQYSPALAAFYCRLALTLCRLMRVEPSILLHPLDLLGCDDVSELSFFPAMGLPAARKLAIAERAIDQFAASYEIVTMEQHAAAIRR